MGDEYEDEDFEDYDDDDFEEEEEEPKEVAKPAAPPPKPSSSPKTSAPSKQGASASASSPKTPTKVAKSPGKDKLKGKEDPSTPTNLPDHVLEMRRAVNEENKKLAPQSKKTGGGGKGGGGIRSSLSSFSPERLRPSAPQEGRQGRAAESEPPVEYSVLAERAFVEPTRVEGGGLVLKAEKNEQSGFRRERFKDLVKGKMIKLQHTDTIFMLELKPMTPYDLFARGYSRVGKESTECQCPDDERQRVAETQSDAIKLAHAAAQCPEDIGLRSAYEKARHRDNVRQSGADEGGGLMGYDSSRLASFLLRVEPVVSALLGERSLEHVARQSSLKRFEDQVLKPGQEAATSFSSVSTGYTAACKTVLKGRAILCIGVVGALCEFVSVCYGPKKAEAETETTTETGEGGEGGGGSGEAEGLEGLGVVCVWKRAEPSAPCYTLASHLTPSAFAVSPVSSSPLCVLGSREGTLSLWDLREAHAAAAPVFRKPSPLVEPSGAVEEGRGSSPEGGSAGSSRRGGVVWRLASYSTQFCHPLHVGGFKGGAARGTSGYQSAEEEDDFGGEASRGTRHVSKAEEKEAGLHMVPVVDVRMVRADGKLNRLTGEGDDASSVNVQVVSLDEGGTLLLWAVVALHDDDDDVFLSYGGRMKLLHIGTLAVHGEASSLNRRWLLPRCTSLCVHPGDGNIFFVGTEAGDVLSRARYGKGPRPSKFRVHGSGEEELFEGAHGGYDASNAVASVAVCPFTNVTPDGSLLMLVGREDGSVSLFSTSKPSPIRTWSSFAQGAIVRICWSPTRPSSFVVLDSTSRLHFFILLDKSTDGPVQVEHVDSSQVVHIDIGGINMGTAKQRAVLSVAFASGHIQLHELKSRFSEPTPREEEEVRTLVADWF